MGGEDSKTITLKNKKEYTRSAEPTRTGPVFTPDVDIFETETGIVMLADIPGVSPGNLDIDLTDDILTIDAEADAPGRPGEETVLGEYESGRYYRQFNLSHVIDQSRIDATLKDGVLRLTLPKFEKVLPRRIKIKVE